MNRSRCAISVLVTLLLATCAVVNGAEDPRTVIQSVNTPRSFPVFDNRAQWEKHADQIRERILVSCGLWPLPRKTSLNARVFGRIEREDYSVEKVYFESFPGVFVAGNLYRPLGKSGNRYPGVLNPHGHWDNGRMANEHEGSIAARCISFARQGMVAFSYDMIGYNDTFFAGTAVGNNKTPTFYERHRRFATAPANLLWGINLMGLQTWNSIRALDFLESLPDVDPTRLACTGESGGGTQTYILGAIDDRLAAQAPVVMVSHSMQGGCSCENAPGLRVNFSNVEIAAVAAPRPQIVVGATGDWTRDTMTVEGPAIQAIYKLFNASEKLRYVTFDFRHNYNQTSREAVYDFFGSVLKPDRPASKEAPYSKEPDHELRVFPDEKLPAGAKTEAELVSYLVNETRKQVTEAIPSTRKEIAAFKEKMMPAWQHTLQVEPTVRDLSSTPVYLKSAEKFTTERLFLGRTTKNDRIPAILFTPSEKPAKWAAILVHPEGKSAFLENDSAPGTLVRSLLDRSIQVLVIDSFLTGESENYEISSARKQAELFFTTYNVTDTQARVQDILTASAFLKKKRRGANVALFGSKQAGLWSMLAAPGVDAVFADCNQIDPTDESRLLEPDLFVPGLLKLGGFETAALLAVPNPIHLSNVSTSFSTNALHRVYSLHDSQAANFTSGSASEDQFVTWITALR